MVAEGELATIMPQTFDHANRPGKVFQLFSEVVPFDYRVTT